MYSADVFHLCVLNSKTFTFLQELSSSLRVWLVSLQSLCEQVPMRKCFWR